jgi:hypothetical protein
VSLNKKACLLCGDDQPGRRKISITDPDTKSKYSSFSLHKALELFVSNIDTTMADRLCRRRQETDGFICRDVCSTKLLYGAETFASILLLDNTLLQQRKRPDAKSSEQSRKTKRNLSLVRIYEFR